jgi:hypothetical protein
MLLIIVIIKIYVGIIANTHVSSSSTEKTFLLQFYLMTI